jgi:phosphoribosylaminoimidazole carboxylase (NCAIR synthetase)
MVDVLTIEIELVNLDALEKKLENEGLKVYRQKHLEPSKIKENKRFYIDIYPYQSTFVL